MALMFYPQAKVLDIKEVNSDKPFTPKPGRAGQQEGQEEQETIKTGGHFVNNIPKNLTIQDCLVEDFKGKSIEEQRSFFEEKMKEMARSDHDQEDGWVVSVVLD